MSQPIKKLEATIRFSFDFTESYQEYLDDLPEGYPVLTPSEYCEEQLEDYNFNENVANRAQITFQQ